MFSKSPSILLTHPSRYCRARSTITFNSCRPRTLHQTTRLNAPSKDSQDKDSLNPRSTEYSKSQSDDGSARIEKTAFDPSETSPEGEMAMAREESGSVSNYFRHSFFFFKYPLGFLFSHGCSNWLTIVCATLFVFAVAHTFCRR